MPMLYELIYRSTASSGLSEKDFNDILSTARSFNEANHITGCLLFHGGQFLQILEGEFQVLLDLFDRIKHDPRHYDVLLLHMKESEYRIYPNWTMAFKTLDDKNLKDHSGVTEFTEIDSEKKESTIAKSLFTALSSQIVKD
ncbi:MULTISPECIES: BLUF domain-containing protein [Roseivirga]|jgi:hypothetical protein|uniref:BLUF domain-containing protein n=2 Tax=Roseivirga thermotolerans TaxID=1758176 RepID=A0ABQ3I6F5_9BACT|nr:MULTISPECIES: BLUF domain-containing protein [Roseivirga]MEC7753217.1 BLUF domain-containing protein [Bacteroidota bacterium]GHE59403.1 hypothetical protein GCM10011340_12590 [Roseivirga thermotolerans]|tara:strand:- start:43 stop:465 length:423 start_codon:yes stop_codon:yes gene_type:complete